MFIVNKSTRVDHAEYLKYDQDTRQYHTHQVWWAIIAVTSRYITLSKRYARKVFAGRCEICVHGDLTYYVDHAERSIYDEDTRQHRPCRIW